MTLTGKNRRQLRALGHHLSPVVQIGENGVTDGLVAAVKQALKDHELIKIKFVGEHERDDRDEAVNELAGQTQSEVAQIVGKTALLWKKRDQKSKIHLKDR